MGCSQFFSITPSFSSLPNFALTLEQNPNPSENISGNFIFSSFFSLSELVIAPSILLGHKIDRILPSNPFQINFRHFA